MLLLILYYISLLFDVNIYIVIFFLNSLKRRGLRVVKYVNDSIF